MAVVRALAADHYKFKISQSRNNIIGITPKDSMSTHKHIHINTLQQLSKGEKLRKHVPKGILWSLQFRVCPKAREANKKRETGERRSHAEVSTRSANGRGVRAAWLRGGYFASPRLHTQHIVSNAITTGSKNLTE
jgi:hypothetical protein